MTPALQAAIEDLYRVFRAPPPERIEGCPCCIDQSELRVLHTVPLRKLSSDDLCAFSSSALLTVGEEADVRYFLPRILELCALEPDGFPDIEIRLGKLGLMDWQAWPADERRAIGCFVREWLEGLLLRDHGDVRQLDALVCGAAIAGLDVDAMLARIDQSPASAQTLFEDNSYSFWKHGGPSNAFWPQMGPGREAFVRWLEKMARG